jgi:dihydrofolate reductase
MIGLVASSINNVIGKDGELPWECKGDLAFFKKMTMGKYIIVGYNTFFKLPELPGRKVCVLSKGDVPNAHFTCNRLSEVPHEAIVCGGANVYDQLLSECDIIYVTTIRDVVEGDTHFNEDWLKNHKAADVVENCDDYFITRYVKQDTDPERHFESDPNQDQHEIIPKTLFTQIKPNQAGIYVCKKTKDSPVGEWEFLNINYSAEHENGTELCIIDSMSGKPYVFPEDAYWMHSSDICLWLSSS